MISETDCEKVYARDGVVKVEGLLSLDEIAEFRLAIARYVEHVLPTIPAGDYVLEADGKSVRNLWRMDTHDPSFAHLERMASMGDLLPSLLHGAPILKSVETFNKPSRVGSGVPPHQDNAYFCLSPPDALTVWIAIDPVTRENGPVNYVVGSHRGGLRSHTRSGVNGNSMGLAEPLGDHTAYAPTLEPGDALIHHCETVHYSSPNDSDTARRALLLVFRAEHCIVHSSLRQAYEHAQA